MVLAHGFYLAHGIVLMVLEASLPIKGGNLPHFYLLEIKWNTSSHLCARSSFFLSNFLGFMEETREILRAWLR
jgi:hypothetical protein